MYMHNTGPNCVWAGSIFGGKKRDWFKGRNGKNKKKEQAVLLYKGPFADLISFFPTHEYYCSEPSKAAAPHSPFTNKQDYYATKRPTYAII
jgi:hypothetical protein